MDSIQHKRGMGDHKDNNLSLPLVSTESLTATRPHPAFLLHPALSHNHLVSTPEHAMQTENRSITDNTEPPPLRGWIKKLFSCRSSSHVVVPYEQKDYSLNPRGLFLERMC